MYSLGCADALNPVIVCAVLIYGSMPAVCCCDQQDLADMTRINNELRAKLEKAMEQLIAAQTAKEHAREKVWQTLLHRVHGCWSHGRCCVQSARAQ
jgi:hypothetical protein